MRLFDSPTYQCTKARLAYICTEREKETARARERESKVSRTPRGGRTASQTRRQRRLGHKSQRVFPRTTNKHKQKTTKFKVSSARTERQCNAIRRLCCAALRCAALCVVFPRTEIELVVNAREDLSDGGRVGDHADGALHLGQITAGDDSGRLVVDAALETGGTPVDELCKGDMGQKGTVVRGLPRSGVVARFRHACFRCCTASSTCCAHPPASSQACRAGREHVVRE